MIIINEQAEKRLVEFLQDIRKRSSTWRCIHLPLSLLDAPQKAMLNAPSVQHLRKELLGSYDGKMFVCHDLDQFIFFQGVPGKILETIKVQYAGVIPSEMLHKNMRVFELAIEWYQVITLAEAKLAMSVQDKKPELKPAALKISDDEVSAARPLFARRHERKEKKILVVEDDVFSRRMVRNLLTKEYEVIEAANGQDAITNYLLHAPDVVFLDIELPDINGQIILRKLREIDPEAYVVMLSGNSYKEYILNAMEQGAKGFVGKPFPKEKLKFYIEHCPTIKRS